MLVRSHRKPFICYSALAQNAPVVQNTFKIVFFYYPTTLFNSNSVTFSSAVSNSLAADEEFVGCSISSNKIYIQIGIHLSFCRKHPTKYHPQEPNMFLRDTDLHCGFQYILKVNYHILSFRDLEFFVVQKPANSPHSNGSII